MSSVTMVKVAVGATALVLSMPLMAQPKDFGEQVEQLLQAQSVKLFGFTSPVAQSATGADVIPRELADAGQRQFLAGGLSAEFVTRSVGGLGDMIAFWPDDLNYTHVIVCNEWGRAAESTPEGNDGYNPSVQRIDVGTGDVETVLFGMARCDGIRTTQWGTVLATEENGADGSAYEILDPLNTTGYWIADRGAAGADADIRTAVDGPTADNGENSIKKRIALAAQSWEGLEVLDNGVVIGGDELRGEEDVDGGAIFRFVPDTFYDCDNNPVRPGQLCDNTIDDLADSPFVNGNNYALIAACSTIDADDPVADPPQYGQGCEYGASGHWVGVSAATARFNANDNGATGYCRPEDLHVDRSWGEFVGDDGIRWCWNNTCGGRNGETLCVTESSMDTDANTEKFVDLRGTAGVQALLTNADSELASANVTRFVQNDAEMRSQDNLDIQPFTNNVYIVEDFTHGDIWACLQDGDDRDYASDGCVRMLSVRDPDAEPSGFIFDGTGETAFYHVQHGEQPADLLDMDSNPWNGETDDLIKITGFKISNAQTGPRAR